MAADNVDVDDSDSDTTLPQYPTHLMSSVSENNDALGDVDINDVMMVEKPKKKRKRVNLCQFCVSPDCWLLAASSQAGLINHSH